MRRKTFQAEDMESGEEITGFFPVLTGALKGEFDRVAAKLEFSKGEQLYEPGFPCPFVPFILSGVVRVFKIGESGREITLYRVMPGEICILSSTCSISNKQYPAIAEAEEPTVLYVVPGGAFRSMLKRFPVLQDMIFDALSSRLVEMMTVVEEVTFRRVDQRIVERLLQATLPPHPLVVNTTHASLAVDLGSAREVISRILKDFERQGLVKLERGRVEVVERGRLTLFLEELRGGAI